MSEKTFTLNTYDGSEFMVVLDGEVYHVVEDIHWEKDFTDSSSPKVRGEIKCTLFDEMPLDKYAGRSYLDMEIFFLSEGETVGKVYSFRGLQITGHKAGICLESVSEDLTYKFTASNVSYHSNYSWDVQEAQDHIEKHGDLSNVTAGISKWHDYRLAEVYKKELKRRDVYSLVKEEK